MLDNLIRMRPLIALTATLFLLAVLVAPSTTAATYTLTVKTDAGSYTGSQTLTASGAVAPAPGPSTAVLLQILSPSGSRLAIASASVDGTTGTYQQTFVLGGTSSWVAGTYTLAATWGNSATNEVNATTTFTYSPAATTTTTATSSTRTQTLPPGAHVSILNGSSANPNLPGYSPASITVVIGVNNTVTWTNNDIAVHTVTADDGSFNSGDIAPAAFWSYTFTTPGVYSYHCVYHNWMKGTVTVKAASSATSTTTSASPTTATTSTTSTTSSSSTTTSSPTSTTPSSTSTTSTTSATTTLTPTTTPTTASTTTSSSSTSSSSGGIPEFPFQLLGVTVLTAIVVASYLLARRRQISGGLVGKSPA